MRLFVDRRVEGRAETHTLAIGVGAYPHLDSGGGRRSRRAGALKQLRSPGPSAKAFGQWMETEHRLARAPLGTIEVLASIPDFAADPHPPTMEHIMTAVKEWKQRADTSPENVAVLFFCGHGVSVGVHNGLLAADFGDDDDALLQKAIDIDGLHEAMDACRARHQVFFIDTCRNTPTWLDELAVENGIGSSILDRPRRQGRRGMRDAPRFSSALPGERAYGREELSVFTEALIETLRGAGAMRPNGQWIVSTDTVVFALRQLLALYEEADGAGNPELAAARQQRATVDRYSGFVFHELSQEPKVVLSIGCEPPHANAVADLALRTPPGGWQGRGARTADKWRVRCDPGIYDVRAEFSAGEFRNKTRPGEIVHPPVATVTLEVL
jgi:hypothetical protein